MSRIFRTNRSVLCISILILIQCWISSINFGCVAQDDFQDDAGADTTGSSGKGPNSSNKNDNKQTKTIAEQTIQAALQFGVLVGVALMVGILFMLNVGADLLYTAICDKYTSAFSKHKPVDIEDQDPASLVGSFKRYK